MIRSEHSTYSTNAFTKYLACILPSRGGKTFTFKISMSGTPLVAQWLGICLPMQGTQVRSLVWEDPTCCGATEPVRHNYWACALEPVSHNHWACALEPMSRNYWARVLQLLKPVCLEPVLRNKRSHHNEKPVHHNEEQPLLAATKTQCSQKEIKISKFI